MPRRAPLHSFIAKLIVAPLMVVAIDLLFQDAIGSWLGGFALAWVIAVIATLPAVRHGPALVAVMAAAAFALVMADDPGLLAWVLFWAALSIATLLPRTAGFDDAVRWGIRLALHGATGPFTPLADLMRLFGGRPGRARRPIRTVVATLALPLVMGAVFTALFASANPLIEGAFAGIRFPPADRIVFWLVMGALIWPSLRPSRWATRLVGSFPEASDRMLPEFPIASVLISLGLFNVIFAIQNGLDLAFLWSGAPLPGGVTLADYAHRGAYPLIATALLAGLFVLMTIRPGTVTAASRTIRRLVMLWVAQNLLLVASSMLRTWDYIEAFSMTRLRIAALMWMALVAIGLVLIVWRALAGRSARWLINGNAFAALVFLAIGSIVDLGAVAAMWNVRHARELTGAGPALDLCYLDRLGSSALPALLDLEQQPIAPSLHDRVRRVRADVMTGRPGWNDDGLVAAQADWRRWTWRGARRLAQARAILGDEAIHAVAIPAGATVACDGSIDLPKPPPSAPLTGTARP